VALLTSMSIWSLASPSITTGFEAVCRGVKGMYILRRNKFRTFLRLSHFLFCFCLLLHVIQSSMLCSSSVLFKAILAKSCWCHP
jgi:hypothetical protein